MARLGHTDEILTLLERALRTTTLNDFTVFLQRLKKPEINTLSRKSQSSNFNEETVRIVIMRVKKGPWHTHYFKS